MANTDSTKNNSEADDQNNSSFGTDTLDVLKDFLRDFQENGKSTDWAKDSTQYIQSNPWTAIAGAVAVGFVLGHLFKSAPNPK